MEVNSKLCILALAVLVTSCQRVTFHDLWEDIQQYEFISINETAFLKRRGVSATYTVKNELPNQIYIATDLKITQTSQEAVIEVKNAWGMKSQLHTGGLRISVVGSDALQPKQSVQLSTTQWRYPFWYPKWFPGQKIRISTLASICENPPPRDFDCDIVLVSDWTKVD